MADNKWLLDFQGVQIARHEHILFEHLDLQIASGEFVYLTGPVGAGKSTLLKTISAEVPLSQGKATVMGFDLTRIKSKDLPKLRRRMGIVFQNFQLLPDQTVHDNLQDVGLETKSYKYPHELSGGEQQRVAIARALIGHPELILADEPTGNLDAANGLAIAELLHRLTKERGTAVIMATHNLQVLETYPARCIALDQL